MEIIAFQSHFTIGPFTETKYESASKKVKKTRKPSKSKAAATPKKESNNNNNNKTNLINMSGVKV
jgi:hypothetical protein